MAKKKEFSIQTVKKHLFWICVPLGLVLAVVLSFISIGKLGAAFYERQRTLEDRKKTVEGIRTQSEHPNENTIKEIENCTKELRGRVQQAWRILERDQRNRNRWPEEVGPSFNKEVSSKKFGDGISTGSRELYMTFVENFLPRMEVEVDRRRREILVDGEWVPIEWTKEGGSSGQDDLLSGYDARSGMRSGGTVRRSPTGVTGNTRGGGAGAGSFLPIGGEEEETERIVGIVDWPNPETRSVKDLWVNLPKSNEVWYTQEELWVYSALLSVVKESNVAATGPHNAVVKRIEALLIGQDASAELATQLNMRLDAPAASSGDSTGGGSGSPGGPGGMDSMTGGGGSTGGRIIARTEEEVANLKRHYRYVDETGKPLAYTDTPPFAQFNRMPIVLKLVVDQRYIPEILVNCANCAMPIDVLRVRINPGSSKPFDIVSYVPAAGLQASDGSGGGPGGDVGYGSGGTTNVGGTSAPGASDTVLDVDGAGGIYGSNAVPIEIYGCINIFNSVEHDTGLKSDEEGENTESE